MHITTHLKEAIAGGFSSRQSSILRQFIIKVVKKERRESKSRQADKPNHLDDLLDSFRRCLVNTPFVGLRRPESFVFSPSPSRSFSGLP